MHVHGRDAAKLPGSPAAAAGPAAAEVVEEVCDIGDLDAVRTWAADLNRRVPALHGLVHNAGTMTDSAQESPQGTSSGWPCTCSGPT